METLFDPVQAEDIKRRIQQLNAVSERQWGKMTLTQTLAHCTAGVEMAKGAIRPKRAPFPFSFVGLMLKPMILKEGTQMRRNSPSSPELFLVDASQDEVEREQARLLSALDDFVTRGPSCCTTYPHPFLGPLKPEQWAVMMHKHLDHHLRQFGV